MKRLLIPFLALSIGMASITQSANAISTSGGIKTAAGALIILGCIFWGMAKKNWDLMRKLDKAIEDEKTNGFGTITVCIDSVLYRFRERKDAIDEVERGNILFSTLIGVGTGCITGAILLIRNR